MSPHGSDVARQEELQLDKRVINSINQVKFWIKT